MSMTRQEAQAIVTGWQLGQTSQRYESSGLGPGTISSGRNDHGGVSYGSYQLSSASGTLREYLAQSRYGAHFEGLKPATPAFDARWRELARTDPAFGADQHAFIGRSHYQSQLERLAHAGLDVRDRGRAVQDCVWSTSVQLRNLTTRIFRDGLQERFGSNVRLADLSDREIVEAVQDYKAAHTTTLFRSSPAWHRNLVARANHERTELVRLADAEQRAPSPMDRGNTPAPLHAPSTDGPRPAPHRDGELRHVQSALAHLGYTGADGRLVAVDGRMGRNTRHALEQYQRDHALPVTGRVDDPTAAGLRADELSLASSTHPAHPLYRQALDAVYALDAKMGVPHGRHSIALAGQAAAEAAKAGLARIDRIEVSRDGRHAQAVEFRGGIDLWATNRASAPFDLAAALTRTLQESSAQARQALEAQASVPSLREQKATRAPLL
ncbi:peptidoglycan-binding domain-containing protein [Cognatilysobacter segetis]|uniref:peptidoglycan-binding domain-containing protein n=1 Tax=Cognatilysobacter segetis TaxID=2492394 RepID=UPI00105E3A00|nr:peptidoglycan-binding domain-containing protein [Lysobacter segetis]